MKLTQEQAEDLVEDMIDALRDYDDRSTRSNLADFHELKARVVAALTEKEV